MLTPSRPILRYHGGKWKLAPWIIEHFPAHRTYVEPYGGAASVLLRKPRSYAEVYNDMDGEVVNLFRVARDHGEELARVLSLTPFSRDEFAQSRKPTEDPMERARRMVIRSYMGFGSNAHNKVSGFRANTKRAGTTPAMDWSRYPDSALPAIIQRLQGVVIEHRDALQVIEAHDGRETVHYVDPPYVHSTRGKGGDYRHEMTDSDHARLAEKLRNLSGFVILSGYESPIYADLYAGWRKVQRATHADGARARTEVLWLSPNCPDSGLFKAS
jgi:DNA adenine methylase